MIKQGIKNYLISLKYVFTPLGVFALSLILGLSIFIPHLIAAIMNLFDNAVEIVGSIEVDGDEFLSFLISAVRALDWNNPLAAVKTMLTEKWLTNTLGGALDKLFGGSVVAAELSEAVEVCIDAIMKYAIIFAVILVIGLVAGYYFTKWLIRRSIAKRTLWKFFLITLVDALLSAALTLICIWLAAIWWASAFITPIVSVLLVGAFALIEAYLTHGKGKIEFKQIVNFKNILKLLLTNVIVFVLSGIITVIAILINAVAGLIVGIAFIVIAIIVTGLNAEAYVKTIVSAGETVSDGDEQSIAA